MKKLIKSLMLIFSLFMVGTLSSCSEKKVTPTFEGLIIENNQIKKEVSEAGNLNNILTEQKIEKDIEDLVKIEITKDDELKYFVEGGKEFTLQVKLNNPSNFKIDSFTINDKKYESHLFLDKSDFNNIYVNVLTTSEAGYHDFSIANLKYVDGEELKDIDLTNKKTTITAGVRQEILPKVIVDNKNVKTTETEINLTLTDNASVLEGKVVKVYLSDGSKIIDEQEVKLGKNKITFKNLNENTLYQYAVMTSFDLMDGEYEKPRTLIKEVFTTSNIFTVGEANIDQTSIMFSLNKNGDEGKVTKVELYDKNDYKLVDSLEDFSTLKFDKLLSNHAYSIKVTYTYMGEKEQTGTLIYDFVTKEKVAPVIEFESISSGQTTIDFNYNLKDLDDILRIKGIELYDGNKLARKALDMKIRRFDGLYSNRNYTIKIIYTYDLNDGKGEHESFIKQDVMTKEKVAPVVKIENVTSDETSISYSVNVIDNDETYMLDRVELYLGEKLVKTKYDTSKFSNLLSNKEYTIKVIYKYNLNEGKDDVVKEIKVSKATLVKEAPVVSIKSVTSDKTSIDYSLYVNDLYDTYNLEKVALCLGNKVVQTKTTVEPFTDLLSNTLYTIKVTYSYDLNDGSNKKLITLDYSISTKVMVAPKVTIKNELATEDKITFDLNKLDPDSNLIITKIELLEGDDVVQTLNDYSNLTFDNLYSNINYTIKVTYTYDLNEGKGANEIAITKEILTKEKIAPSVTIENVVSDKTSIDYDIRYVDKSSILVIDGIELYRGSELVDEKLTEEQFINLLSNNEYTIKVLYHYDLNDKNGDIKTYVESSITTEAMVAPSVNLTNVTSDHTSISYDVSIEDTDKVYKFEKVELYLEGKLVDTKNELASFTGLLSNKGYEIHYVYSYDLNDGYGKRTTYITYYQYTSSYTTPTLDINNIKVTSSSISGKLNLSDSDNIANITTVELYKGETLVSSNTNGLIYFDGLEASTDYIIKVSYSYDLNEGNGVTTSIYEYNVKTGPTVVANNLKITNTSEVSVGETIFVEITVDNPTNLKCEYVIINGIQYQVEASSTPTKLFVNIMVDNQFVGGDTTLTLESIQSTYEGNPYEIKVEQNNTANIYINGEFIVENIEFVDANLNHVDYAHTSEDVSVMLTTNIKNGYNVEKLTYRTYIPQLTPSYYPTYVVDKFTKNNENQYIFKGNLNNGFNSFEILEITYSNSHITKTYNYDNLKIYINMYETKQNITQSSDLLNMNSDYYYELQNDIDLTGIEWIGKEFKGIFNGNGHSINNMSVVKTFSISDSNSDVKLGLFSEGYGVIENLTLNNVNISVQINENVYYRIGSIIGKNTNNLVVKNCGISENSLIKVNDKNIDNYYGKVGGLIGCSDSTTTIINCYNKALISGRFALGGIIGEMNSLMIKIENSYNEGMILGHSSTGGLIGYIGGGTLSITNSYNCGSISGDDNVGGLVGGESYPNYNLKIIDSYNSGSVSGKNYVGGLIGRSDTTTITRCYNKGSVNGHDYVGGLIGQSDSITTTINSYNSGSISGGNYIAGLIGLSDYDLKFINCYNSGDVIGTYSSAGLLCYSNFDILILNSYNSGSISISNNSGGLIGQIYGFPTISKSYSTTIYNEYDTLVTLEQLNNKKFYLDILKWDETIWNLDALDVSNGIYPTINNGKISDFLTVSDAALKEDGTKVQVKGVIISKIANKNGVYIVDETGTIAVTCSFDLATLSIGDEVYLKGIKKHNRKDTTDPTIKIGQCYIADAEMINNTGKHEIPTTSFIKDKTVEDLLAYNVKDDYTTNVYTLTGKLTIERGTYASIYYIVSTLNPENKIKLYSGNVSQYDWLDEFESKEVTFTFALCNWNDKDYYTACIFSATDGTKTLYNDVDLKKKH